MRFFRPRIPAALQAAFAPDEHLLAGARVDGGGLLAATRYGLYVVCGEEVQRFDWHLISKARLTNGTLRLTVATERGRRPDGAVVLRDEPELTLPLAHPARLTDVVHHRVRGSVAASAHAGPDGAGVWVVLRRVPGRDGLTVQLRPDAGVAADRFQAEIDAAMEQIWPETVPGRPRVPRRRNIGYP